MADPGVYIPDAVVPLLYRALADVDVDVDEVQVPERLRALSEGRWQLAEASGVVVAAAPHHAHVLTVPYLPGSEELAELLDLDVSDDTTCQALGISGTGDLETVPAPVAQRIGERSYRQHDVLTVSGRDVEWWVTDAGEVHACTVDGLARGLAWAGGQWHRRWELAALLTSSADDARDQVERYYDADDAHKGVDAYEF
jgi:hypothetical protein